MTVCHIPSVLYISTYFSYIDVSSKRKVGRNSGTRLLIPARSFCCGQQLRECVAGALGKFGRRIRNVGEEYEIWSFPTDYVKHYQPRIPAELGKSHS